MYHVNVRYSCAGRDKQNRVFENFRNGLATCDVFDRVLEVHVFFVGDTPTYNTIREPLSCR
jgi:hypothetical protein